MSVDTPGLSSRSRLLEIEVGDPWRLEHRPLQRHAEMEAKHQDKISSRKRCLWGKAMPDWKDHETARWSVCRAACPWERKGGQRITLR